jgi:GntR family transcriptional regulator
MTVKLQPGPTTMYGQLGIILRSKIMSGEWPTGFEIPTLSELCETYSVARVTARQAVQNLVAEGMLSSQRGRRTSVSYVRPELDAEPLFTSIGSPLSDRPNYSVVVLEQQVVRTLPIVPFIGRDEGPYALIRKVDREGSKPYAYSENYVAKEIFDSFPRGAAKKSKLARLVLKYGSSPLNEGRERISVAAADVQDAERLDCMISAPVVRTDRVFCDADGRVVYFSRLTYPGDRFLIERDVTQLLKEG